MAQALRKPFSEIRARALDVNTYRIDPDEPIYRIAELLYVEQDIKEHVLTFKAVHQGAWGDPYENPLWKLRITTPWGIFSPQSLLDDYFAVCWSSMPLGLEEHWRNFSYGEPAVRIESTPRLLLERIMNEDDRYMSLRHFVGRVHYENQAAIEQWISSIDDYTMLMDTQGSRLVQSLMLLRSDHQFEQEVRVVCTSLKNSEEKWWVDHVRIQDGRAKLPFDWRGAINSIVLGPQVDNALEQVFRTFLRQEGITCPVTR